MEAEPLPFSDTKIVAPKNYKCRRCGKKNIQNPFCNKCEKSKTGTCEYINAKGLYQGQECGAAQAQLAGQDQRSCLHGRQVYGEGNKCDWCKRKVVFPYQPMSTNIPKG